MTGLRPSDHRICFARPRQLALSAWSQHVPFAMYLVDVLRPTSIVELGTRKGVSYSAFCQAVDMLGMSTRCMAVDSWRGDAHTGAYGPRVLDDLRRHHDPRYGHFSELHRSTFDEAATAWSDGSIDLLHIDGFHTYEAASHDFETWRSKMSPRGIVLFHDVAERGRDFGVWKVWEELCGRHAHFEFRHGHGLGVLGVGEAIPESAADLFLLSDSEAEQVRRFFHGRGRLSVLWVLAGLAWKAPARWGRAVVEQTRTWIPGSLPGGLNRVRSALRFGGRESEKR